MKKPRAGQQDWLDSMKVGTQRFQQRCYDDAVSAFELATAMRPKRVEGWINLGAALLETGRYKASASALQKAISINPRLMVSHMMLGDALRQLGQRAQSLASYRKAVALESTPMGLNKLACALRITREVTEAEKLYRQAINLDPGFTLARVNMATLQLEMSRFEKARLQLEALGKLKLPLAERDEVVKSLLTLSEYLRLREPLAVLNTENDPAPLEAALGHIPADLETVDERALNSIRHYIEHAENLDASSLKYLTHLPEDWSFIEAMFMVPLVETVDEYLELKAKDNGRERATGALLESINMVDVIQATRTTQNDLRDPVKAELHLRHWHALASRGVDGFMPGHFKYTQNQTTHAPTLKRVEPALASSTFRCFVTDIYKGLEPGITRAFIVWMAVCDLHPFADGNGRVAMSWMNRELEWAGLMPALFPLRLGIKGELGIAMSAVRQSKGNFAPLLEVIIKAQNFAISFCEQMDRD